MGKDLKGKELGKGITQRKDGLYMGRAMIDGKSVGPFYGRDLEEVKKKLQSEKTNAQLNNLYQIIESERSIPSLEEWAMTWFKLYKQPTLKRKNSNSYMRSVKNYILCNIGSKPIDLVRQLDIQLCVAEATKRGIQGKSLREAVGTLQQCFDSAVANGYIRVNPAIGVLVANSSPVKRRVLSQEEEKRLRTYLVESKNWFCEMIHIMLLTGMRIGEIAGLQWKDIDFQNKMIHVRRQLICEYEDGEKIQEFTEPKTENSERLIPFFSETEKWIRSQYSKVERLKKSLKGKRRIRKEYSDLVFFTSRGTPISRHTAESAFRRIVDQMNKIEWQECKVEGRLPVLIKPINPHATRHTFATRCFEKGMRARVVQEIMGHSNFNTTVSYIHIMEGMMREEADKIGNFLEDTIIYDYNRKEYEELMGVI